MELMKKKMKKIKYIAFYDKENEKENRQLSLAATNKIDYIINALNNLNYYVEIISPSWTNNNNGFYITNLRKFANKSILLFNSFGTKNKFINVIKREYSLYQLKNELLNSIKNGETILVYHSTCLYDVLQKVKNKKNVKIILEVEEIYSDIIFKGRKKEYKMFDLADKYIFTTKLLNEKINIEKKEHCISHGTYKVEEQVVDKYNDGKIHIVYSGIIDQLKGAMKAVLLSDFLDKKYVIHIIGFGNEKDINSLKKIIESKNKDNKCKVYYDGKKVGKEYIEYIQKCDIGLSIQSSNANYNDTSFPSKILAYLSNGLRVVSVNIPAIKTSDVGDILYYYDGDSPEEIAKTIMSIDMNEKYDSRKLIKKLDTEFTKNLNKMLGSDIDND